MSNRDYDQIADPELLARLASWFGEGPLPPPDQDEVNRQIRAETLAVLEESVDPALAGRLSAQVGEASSLLAWADDPLLPHDPAIALTRLPSGPLEDIEDAEIEPPDDIYEAVRNDSTPQSVLRDLFRPVSFFEDVAYEVQFSSNHVAFDPTGAAQEAMATRRAPPALEPAPKVIAEDLIELRSLINAPWEEIEIDPERRTERLSISQMWTSFGGEDPDL